MLTPDSRRNSFPVLEQMTYLNTAAEGIPPVEVKLALGQYFNDKLLGMDGRVPHFQQWDNARYQLARALGLSVDEVTICSSSSEAFNLAALALGLKEGDEVVINDLDFPAGATPWLQESCPATVKIWRARDGVLPLEELPRLLSPRTRLVTTSLVSFFNGAKLPLAEVAAAVERHSRALLAVDVTQALGRVPLELDGADLIVSSTHKWILATHGGGLVGVPKAKQDAWTVPAGGWFNLVDAFGPNRFDKAVSRPGAGSFTVGMPNFPAVYAIGAALEYIQSVGVEAIERAARPLVATCLEGLTKLPIELLSPRDMSQLAGILAFRHPQAEALFHALHVDKIHVMHHAGRLRVALHGYNTPADVERFLESLERALKKL